VTQRSLKREVLLALVETSRHLRHFIDRRAQRQGLTGAQLRVLSRLRRHEGMTQSDLAAELEMTPMSVGGLIDKLAGSGLVERRRDATDRRVNRVYLTMAGKRVAHTIDDFREEIAGEVLAGIDEAAIAAALATLAKLKTRLTAENGARPAGAVEGRQNVEGAVQPL
jgi:MarR family transcriptional regulator for hemolysin